MNTFKKKALFSALAGLGVMGMVGSAQAVNLNPDGLGQVLIYPYYTVRANADGNAYDSLISVVNSTGVPKIVKVRFLEGKASQEVLDFNLFLSKYDVWTGYLVPSEEGALLKSNDRSCTAPPIPEDGEEFKNTLFSGNNADGEDETLDRTREGYLEIIEMADVIVPSKLATAITHVNGVPPNCDYAQDGGYGGWQPEWADEQSNDYALTTGLGGLFGSMTLINVNEARDIAYEATALDAFFVPDGVIVAPGSHLFYNSGDILPNFGDVWPKTSTVVNGSDVYITSGWVEPVDAVSAVLMNESVYNEYVLDDSVGAKTDWVVTFPTKAFYYVANPPIGRDVQYLFQRDFRAGGACDNLTINYYDREERTPTTGAQFSPPTPGMTNSLCWEANVVTFGRTASTTSLLFSTNRKTLATNYDNGWARFSFPAPASGAYHQLVGTTVSPATSGTTQYVDLRAPTPGATTWQTVTFDGLPMVGFGVQLFNNGEVVGPSGKTWSSYAGRIAHRFSKSIN
ncbi:MAG: hypothetical protein LBE32_00685 [Burkholderiales bacterium]|jgi:hypothetical protein|nr:hypothetical protein [Burkholderiales bacterium]